MAEFGLNPEDKFKLSLLSIEKRFVELEGAFGELQQKVLNIKMPDNSELEQRISDLEDLIYVEQAGIEELQGMLESKGEAPAISAEEVQKIVEPIVGKLRNDFGNRIGQMKGTLEQMQKSQSNNPQLSNEINALKQELETQMQTIHNYHSEIENLKNKVEQMENAGILDPQQISEINKKLDQAAGQLQVLHHFRAELESLKNKLEPLSPETVKSIVAEISDLRIETGREIREMKDRVGNAPLYADIQFLSNRVKDLKMTVDNLLNMKVELDAKMLNMERNLAEGGGGSTSFSANLISEVEDTKKQMFEMQKRLAGVDGMMKDFMKRIEFKVFNATKQPQIAGELETLHAKMNELYADVEKKALDMNRLAPLDFGERISELDSKISKLEEQLQHVEEIERGGSDVRELLEKIILLETRVQVLETGISSEKKQESIILE